MTTAVTVMGIQQVYIHCQLVRVQIMGKAPGIAKHVRRP